MKFLNKLNVVLLVALIAFACSSNKEAQDAGDSIQIPIDTVEEANAMVEELTATPSDKGAFVGEYLIGDGSTYIVPVADTWEMRDGTGKASDVLTFEGKENDTLSVYSNKDKSVTFKMNPDHQIGKYYSNGEELPVELVGPLEP